jgi:hypothetical protein
LAFDDSRKKRLDNVRKSDYFSGVGVADYLNHWSADMNAPATNPAEFPARLTPGQVLIRGRCIGVRKAKDTFYHLVAMAAPDLYSHPRTVEVSARSRLAEKDNDFSVLCTVGGFPRQFNQTDKATGEVFSVRTADVKLQAVEA